MRKAAGKKTSLKPQPAVKQSLAKAIGSRVVNKSYITFTSSSNDTDDAMLEGSSETEDSENEPLSHVIHQPAVKKGDYVLVKFAKKQHMSSDAGRVVRIDKREDEMQTTYMKRNDMHKSDAVTISWLGIDDLAWHDEQDIITKLPEPTTVGTQLARLTN